MTDLRANDLAMMDALGVEYLIGVDEAGRGPLAGPVVASAALVSRAELEAELAEDDPLHWVKDSKKVTERRRGIVFDQSLPNFQLGSHQVSHGLIDQMNILEATKLAWQESIEQLLDVVPMEASVAILIDGHIGLVEDMYPIKPIIKGDGIHFCIALASIHAKVSRDRQMLEVADQYPEYEFARHKGYGTKLHREAIQKHGLSPIHRRTFCTKFI